MNISITIIGHNEAEHLRDLLPRLKWGAEVIYVDCDSRDDSLAVAQSEGCRTFSRPNNPNLNQNKSFAMEQARGEWIFYLDPDERIPEELSVEIQKTIRDTPHSGFEMNRRNHFFGHWLRYGSQYPDTQLRLFRRGSARFPKRHVHEKLQVQGSIGRLHHDLFHYPYRDIQQFLVKFDFYTSVEAGYLQESGTRVNFWNNFRFFIARPGLRFWRRFLLKGGFLDGMPGLFCAMFDAMNISVRYFKLWEKTRKDEKILK